MKVLVAALCVVLNLSLLPAGAATAPAPTPHGRVDVTVVESIARRPIPRVHVRLVSNAREYDGYTDAIGVVSFDDVAIDTFGVRAEAGGYTFGTETRATTVDGGKVSVTLIGVFTGVRTIGRVAAKASPPPNKAQSIGENDAKSQISGSIGAALATIPTITNAGDGSLLLHNHDASTTAVTVNGAPVFPNTTRDQLGLLGSDLFSSAQFGTGALAGAPNGTVDLETYEPIIDWSGVLQVRPSSYSGLGFDARERGTAGRIGVAVLHSESTTGVPLDGAHFADTSGVAYDHHLDPVSTGDAVTLRYGVTPTNVAYLDVARLSATQPLNCAEQFGPLPCGFGPSNATVNTTSYLKLRDTLSTNLATMQFQVFASHTADLVEFGNRFVNGASAGYDNRSITDRTGAQGQIDVAVSSRRNAEILFSTYHDTSTFSGAFVSAAFPIAPNTQTVSAVSLKLPIVQNKRFTFGVSVGLNASDGTSQTTAGADAQYQLTNRDSLNASFKNGALAAQLGSFTGVGAATDLSFDCAGARALGFGPTVAPATPGSTQQLNVGALHSGARVSFSIAARRETQRDGSVEAIVPGASLAAGTITASYLAQASQTASTICGRPIALTAPSLSYTLNAPATRVINDGVDAGSSIDIGGKIHLDLDYSLSRVRAFGASAAFVAGSNLAPGDQLYGRPLHRASAQVKYAVSRGTTAFAVANVIGGNNPYQANAFTTLDAGVRTQAASGDLIVGMQNITNAAGGPLGVFSAFPNLTRPSTPRSFSVRFRLAAGRLGIDRATLLSKRPSFSGGISYEPFPFENKPGKDWLAPDTGEFLCGPENLAQTRRNADAIRSYQARAREIIERTPSASIPDETFEGATFSYVRGDGTASVRVRIDNASYSKWSGFLRCEDLHEGTYDEVRALHLYSPDWSEREDHGFEFFYQPLVGLYSAGEPVNQTLADDDYAVSPLPNRAPVDPYAIAEKQCPATYRPAVAATIGDLRNYISAIYAGGHPTPPDDLAVVRHEAKTEPWLEIKASTYTYGVALGRCLGMKTYNPHDLEKRGIGAANTPSFNYSPALGFYKIAIMMDKAPALPK